MDRNYDKAVELRRRQSNLRVWIPHRPVGDTRFYSCWHRVTAWFNEDHLLDGVGLGGSDSGVTVASPARLERWSATASTITCSVGLSPGQLNTRRCWPLDSCARQPGYHASSSFEYRSEEHTSEL